MKYRTEKTHPGLETSMRSGETMAKIIGDPQSEWRDMSDEQQKAFQKPAAAEARVLEDEADQGRTR